MPTYDFKCENGHLFDAYLKKFYDEKTDKIKCPECGAESTRLYSNNAVGWILTGAGWAKDGYSNKIKPKEKND